MKFPRLIYLESIDRNPIKNNQMPRAREGPKSKPKTKTGLIAKGSGCSIPKKRKAKLKAKANAQARTKISHLEVNRKEK